MGNQHLVVLLGYAGETACPKGQRHAWDLNSDLLMARSVHAPPALVFLVLRFPPPPPARVVSATFNLLLLPTTFFVLPSVSPRGMCHPTKQRQKQWF